MKFFVEKLNKRYTGHLLWQYRLRIGHSPNAYKSANRNFHTLRSWMIEQYALSTERDSYANTVLEFKDNELFDPPWCWHVDRDYPNTQYIYVQNRNILSHITLRWV